MDLQYSADIQTKRRRLQNVKKTYLRQCQAMQSVQMNCKIVDRKVEKQTEGYNDPG